MNDQSKFMQNYPSLKMDFSLPNQFWHIFVLQMKYFLTSGNAKWISKAQDVLVKVVNILLDNQLSVWFKKVIQRKWYRIKQ